MSALKVRLNEVAFFRGKFSTDVDARGKRVERF